MTRRTFKINESSEERVFAVDLLAVFFGIGAWISVNGLWVELPLLVAGLPEGWALPSYMSIVIQIANIGPLLYSVLHILAPKIAHEKPSIYLLMIVGTTSSLLIAFFWDATTIFAGVRHSTGLLTLLFFLSIVDCSSSVLFMPFMARFRAVYLTSYLVGEGLSGFFPSLVALAQGVGGNPECRNVSLLINGTVSWQIEPYYPDPRFSVTTFFVLLMIFMTASACAFVGLDQFNVARREQVALKPLIQSKFDGPEILQVGTYNQTFVSSVESIDVPFKVSTPEKATSNTLTGSETSVVRSDDKSVKLSFGMLIFLLFIQAWVCALSNGGLPSIQSFSCLPYGNVAYHLAVTLSAMANPLCCLIAYFQPITNVCAIVILAILGTGVSGYIVVLAVMSPSPFLIGYPCGAALMVAAWVVCVGLLTYVKVSIASILRMQEGNGGRNLFWFGVSTQIGSALGSIIAFISINVYQLFQSFYPCV